MVHDELIGVIHIVASKGEQLTEHQKDMATSFGNIIKLALANINLRNTLSELSLHDSLTELYNRRYLNEILVRELERLQREKTTLSLCLIDIDNFKNFNDTYSHLAGDAVLKQIGFLLKNSFRSTDIAFRFGGDEFVLVLLNTEIANATKIMEQFTDKLKNRAMYYKDKKMPKITVSVGVSEAPHHGTTLEDIIKAADHALYNAKKAGKDCIKIYKS